VYCKNNNVAVVATLESIPPFSDGACRCSEISSTSWSNIHILCDIIFHTRLQLRSMDFLNHSSPINRCLNLLPKHNLFSSLIFLSSFFYLFSYILFIPTLSKSYLASFWDPQKFWEVHVVSWGLAQYTADKSLKAVDVHASESFVFMIFWANTTILRTYGWQQQQLILHGESKYYFRSLNGLCETFSDVSKIEVFSG